MAPRPTDGSPDEPAAADGESAADSQSLNEEEALAEGTREVSQVTGSLVLSDTLKVGGRVSCTVDQVLESSASIDIPAGKMVLTVNKQNNEWLLGMVKGLQPGDQVYIPGIRALLEGDEEEIAATLLQDGKETPLTLKLPGLTREERDIILAGCLINYYAK